MQIFELKRGWTFQFDDRPGDIFVFLGMDGMYAKCRALDEVLNKKMCEQYDGGSSFFCLLAFASVTPVDYITGKPVDPKDGMKVIVDEEVNGALRNKEG